MQGIKILDPSPGLSDVEDTEVSSFSSPVVMKGDVIVDGFKELDVKLKKVVVSGVDVDPSDVEVDDKDVLVVGSNKNYNLKIIQVKIKITLSCSRGWCFHLKRGSDTHCFI